MPFPQGHALLIGVGTHQYHPRLDVPITVADAEAVANVLQSADICGYPPGQVKLIARDGATKAGILTALDDLAQRTTATDTVFLFYCGHGAVGTDGNYYLVSHDARVQNGRVVAETSVSEAELLLKLRAIRAERVFIIFNACHSGSISPTLDVEPAVLTTSNPPEDAAAALLGTGKGRIIIVACREEQVSYIGNRSLTLFTQELVDGLQGKGVRNNNGFISAFSLYEHLYESVSETVKTLYQAVQEPELTVLKGVGTFAIARYRGATLGDFDGNEALPAGIAIRQVTPSASERRFNQRIIQIGKIEAVNVEENQTIDQRGANIQVGGGKRINTGGGTYIEGNVKAEGDFTGRDKTVHGDEVRGDKIGGVTIGDVSGGIHGSVIAGRDVSNIHWGIEGKDFHIAHLTIYHSSPPPLDPLSYRTVPLLEEPIRLDVAAPQSAWLSEQFDIAVAVRQPNSPLLAVDDLTKVVSEEGRVFRKENDEIVTYRVEVVGSWCEVVPSHYILKLNRRENSRPCFFQITPNRPGKRTLVVNAYQEDENLAAATRVNIEIQVPVNAQRPESNTLRNVLSGLYETTQDAQRLAQDAGLDTRQINFGDKIINTWHQILAEAHKQGKVKALVSGAAMDYPAQSTALQQAYQAYLQQR